MMTTAIPTDPRELADYLERAELDSSRAPDARATLREERMTPIGAIRSGDAKVIARARDEALRVARMWDGY